MAATVTYQDIEKKLKVFKEGFNPSEIPYIILGAFGTSDNYIRRYKEGKGVVARFDGLMIKGKIAYRQTDTYHMTEELERMKKDDNIRKAAPRIIMVSDGTAVLAYDPKSRIYISREKEPFVIKAEGTGKYSLNLQATIDF